MAKKTVKKDSNIESIGKVNSYLILLLNCLAGLFVACGSILGNRLLISVVNNIDVDRTAENLCNQLVIVFIVLFLISSLFNYFNKKSLDNKSNKVKIIFGILLVLNILMLAINIYLFTII